MTKFSQINASLAGGEQFPDNPLPGQTHYNPDNNVLYRFNGQVWAGVSAIDSANTTTTSTSTSTTTSTTTSTSSTTTSTSTTITTSTSTSTTTVV